jgi:hypothetical protein
MRKMRRTNSIDPRTLAMIMKMTQTFKTLDTSPTTVIVTVFQGLLMMMRRIITWKATTAKATTAIANTILL